MTQLSRAVLERLLAVALTSESETEARIDCLSTLARECHEADALAARSALREGLERLERAAARSSEDPSALSRLAHRVGRTAEALHEYAEARQGYLLAAKLTQAARGGADPGVICHDIGDTWMASGAGEHALAAYREAAEHKAQDATASSHVATLVALAQAEYRYGSPEGCDRALAAALERISREVHLLDAPAVARLASDVAREAQRLDRPAYARDARRLATDALDPGIDSTPAATEDAATPQEAIELLDRACQRRQTGELELARADLRRANELLTPAGMSAPHHLAAVAREIHVVERALAESSEELAADLRRRSAAHGDLDPGLAEVLEALAARAAAANDRTTARHALEWALALEAQPGDERTHPTLEALRPLLDDSPGRAQPPPLPIAALHELGNPHRIWVFDLRRRTVDLEDLRAAIRPMLPEIARLLVERWVSGDDRSGDPAAAQEWLTEIYAARLWIDDELLRDPSRLVDELVEDLNRAWDEREGLGKELTRALERYLLLQVIDYLWREYQEHCAEVAGRTPDGKVSGRDLAIRLWEQFFRLLFNVEVEIEEGTPPVPD